MGYINYDLEPRSDIAFIDMKSFYASVECIERGLNPLTTSLCVMSRADNSKGLILASSPTFKRVFGKQNVSRSYDYPSISKPESLIYAVPSKRAYPLRQNTLITLKTGPNAL